MTWWVYAALLGACAVFLWLMLWALCQAAAADRERADRAFDDFIAQRTRVPPRPLGHRYPWDEDDEPPRADRTTRSVDRTT